MFQLKNSKRRRDKSHCGLLWKLSHNSMRNCTDQVLLADVEEKLQINTDEKMQLNDRLYKKT